MRQCTSRSWHGRRRQKAADVVDGVFRGGHATQVILPHVGFTLRRVKGLRVTCTTFALEVTLGYVMDGTVKSCARPIRQ